LVEAAEWQFRLRKPLPEGGTLGDAIRTFERETGRKHRAAEEAPPIPQEMSYLLEWFWEINCGRPVSMGGYLPLPSTEMLAWATLKRVVLKRWEVDALRSMDAAFLTVIHEKGA
jgi:hypothetical protein